MALDNVNLSEGRHPRSALRSCSPSTLCTHRGRRPKVLWLFDLPNVLLGTMLVQVRVGFRRSSPVPESFGELREEVWVEPGSGAVRSGCTDRTVVLVESKDAVEILVKNIEGEFGDLSKHAISERDDFRRRDAGWFIDVLHGVGWPRTGRKSVGETPAGGRSYLVRKTKQIRAPMVDSVEINDSCIGSREVASQ